MSAQVNQNHPEWGSAYDPRRIAQQIDERNRSLKPVSQTFSSFFSSMPEDIKKRVFINRRIEQVHEQFARVVDPFILEHTNSVYLLKQKENPLIKPEETASSKPIYDLVVYVDNSLCAAELNARRELIRLKYREEFNTIIDVFEIRISRGSYKDSYPFKEEKYTRQTQAPRELTSQECEEVEDIVKDLPKGKMKESFVEAIKAQKRFSDEK